LALPHNVDMFFLFRGEWWSLAIIILAVYSAAVDASAQQISASSSNAAELLRQLSSEEPVVRNGALEQLRSNPDALRDPKIKTALIKLLDQENHVKFSMDDEGYAEYVAWLDAAAAKVIDWSDQRQECILTDGVYLQDELADHAKASLPCLLRRFESAPHFVRGRVAAMMVQALAKGRNEVDPATREAVEQTTLNALHDSDEGVRIDIVKGLGEFGTEDMVPALRVLAKTDPTPAVYGYSRRKWAAEAIAQIQKRAHAHN
jgi:HEAT repeat protein